MFIYNGYNVYDIIVSGLLVLSIVMCLGVIREAYRDDKTDIGSKIEMVCDGVSCIILAIWILIKLVLKK